METREARMGAGVRLWEDQCYVSNEIWGPTCMGLLGASRAWTP